MLLVAFLALAGALAFGLARLPGWTNRVLLGVALALAMLLVAVGGVERAAAPLIAAALALGLLVPAGAAASRSPRVAPKRGRRRAAPASGGKGGRGKAGGGFEAPEIPGYEILEKVGSGGMASVYRARRLADGRTVALKIPMEQYVADAKFIRRFHREAEVAQRLGHENIVRTFEHGSLGVKHYMAMEYVDGRSLEALIEGRELDIETSVEVMKRVARALQHIHAAGIIHRDIKPANIMILRGGIRDEKPRIAPDAVKLMDFGIAGGKVLSRLTMTGARVGTPVYMSPEQARGLKIDHRSDIYSLGLVLYEMLTGQTAFKGGYEAIVHQQIFQTPPPPRQLNLAIPKGLDQLVMRMIAKDADDRPDLDEVVELLERPLDEIAEDDLPNRIVLTVSARQGVLRVLDPQGTLHASLGDIGVGPGAFSAAPLSVAVDSQGCFFAAIFEYRVGQDQHRMIHKLAPDGTPLHAFGTYGMKAGEFLYPISLAVGPDDSVYVLDAETHQVQRFDGDGRHLVTFGGRGGGRGLLNDPRVVIAGGDGSVYVLDHGNRQVQRFDADGSYETRWAFKMGGGQEGMRTLDGVGIDPDGNLYISDAVGGKIRKVTPEGKVELSFSLDPLQGEATDALLDLGVDDEGHLYAARRGGHLIRKYAPDGRLLQTLETYAPVVQMTIDTRRSGVGEVGEPDFIF